jgi:hypothetical protein
MKNDGKILGDNEGCGHEASLWEKCVLRSFTFHEGTALPEGQLSISQKKDNYTAFELPVFSNFRYNYEFIRMIMMWILLSLDK